jgi:hypothetical protein
MIKAVVFDVGECLVDETREYGTWADWLGVPRHTFSAVFGGVSGCSRLHGAQADAGGGQAFDERGGSRQLPRLVFQG